MSIKIAQNFKYQGNDWWKWSVWIDGTQSELDDIKQVTYMLHPTFSDPVRTVIDRESKFKLKTSGWGVFRIFAKVLHTDGTETSLTHDLKLKYPKNTWKNVGEVASDTLDEINLAAAELLAIDNYAAMRELYEQAVDISRKVLGDDHPETAASMSKLASVFYAQGDLLNARELQMKVIESTRKVLGEEHPDVIAYMNNLAMTLRAMGNLQEAEELQEKVLAIGVKILGENHPSTIALIKNLASTLKSREDLTMAQKLQVAAFEIGKKVLVEKQPKIIGYIQNAANFVKEDPEKIQKTYRKILELKSMIFGEERLDATIEPFTSTKRFKDKE